VADLERPGQIMVPGEETDNLVMKVDVRDQELEDLGLTEVVDNQEDHQEGPQEDHRAAARTSSASISNWQSCLPAGPKPQVRFGACEGRVCLYLSRMCKQLEGHHEYSTEVD